MTDDPKDLLIEQAASAYRERSPQGRILPSPSWWDLTAADREVAFAHQLESRLIESSIRLDRRSSTVRAVLDRLR
jgi:hypothetical protein